MIFKSYRQWSNDSIVIYRSHLSKQGERHQLQYTFVNPLETDADIFIDTRFIKKYTTYGRLLEESDFEIEAFALEKQC